VWILPLLRKGAFSYVLAAVGQLLSASAGLLFVNLLTKEDFALFAICTALQQTIVAQSDLGTLAAVGFFYREHPNWESFRQAILPAIANIRLKFFILAGAFLTVIFLLSDVTHGVTGTRILELLCIIFITSWFGIVNSLQVVALRVHGDVNISVAIEAAAGFARLMLAGLMVWFQLLSAEAALLTGLLSSIASFAVGRIYLPQVPLGLQRGHYKREEYKVFRYALPLIPGSLYYTFQPSILIWLSTIYGGSERVADVGAISRIGQIINFIGFGLNFFVLPHLASTRGEAAFKRSYMVIWAIIWSVAGIVLLTVVVSKGAIIGLLGPKYSNLQQEVVTVAEITLLNIAAGYAVLVNRLKGWNKLEPLSTVVLFAGQALLVLIMRMDSTERVLAFGLFYAVWHFLVVIGINIIGFCKPEWATISSGRRPAKVERH
jgi:O-antigen/teichoic acid export membrane protein